jgi:hypothetical protein
MALIPIIIGGGLLVGGSLAITHANKRKPLPADLRAQVIAAFQSRNQQTIGLVLEAIKTGAEGRFKGQAEVLGNAIAIGLKASSEPEKTPADVTALWWAAISSGDPATMRKTSDGLRVKYNTLATALLDCARILGG